MTLGDLPAVVVYVYGVALGLFGGSFLNVVIYRVPRGMSVVRPGSHCPACGKSVAFYDNIPLFSYVLLRGRARCCKARFSARYLVVELIGGALAFAILQNLVFALPDDTSVWRASLLFVTDLAFALGLVAVAFIDLEHMYVPDAISLGGTLVGLATYWLRPGLTWLDVLIGAAVGFGVVWLPFGVLYRWVRGRTGMGLGDAKLVMMAGAWFGFTGALFALLAGAVQGTIAAVVLLAVKGRIEEPQAVQEERQQTAAALLAMNDEERAEAESELAQDPLYESRAPGVGGARIAFGPFLALAMIEYLVIGRELLGGYLVWLGL